MNFTNIILKTQHWLDSSMSLRNRIKFLKTKYIFYNIVSQII